MKIMLNHSSATPHTIKSTKNLNLNGRSKKTEKRSVPGAVATGSQVAKTLTLNGTSKTKISNAVKRRAQTIIEDRSIDAQSRAIIRYGLEVNDPWLPELVRRVDAGETIIETIVLLKHPKLTPGTRTGKGSKR
jgi:hypothetical protein